MSRTYVRKLGTRHRRNNRKEHREKHVVLADYEIAFIEMSLGPSIRLQA